MKDEVYKYIPMCGNSFSDLGIFSARLEELARKGFFITSFSLIGFGRFKKGEPASSRYFVLPKNISTPSQEYCEEIGWTLVDSASQNSHYVYMTNSVEVEVPKLEQKVINKQLYKGLALYCILLAVTIIFSAFNLIKKPESAWDVYLMVLLGIAFLGCVVGLISLLFDLLKKSHRQTINAVRKSLNSIATVLVLGSFGWQMLFLLYATIQLFIYG